MALHKLVLGFFVATTVVEGFSKIGFSQLFDQPAVHWVYVKVVPDPGDNILKFPLAKLLNSL